MIPPWITPGMIVASSQGQSSSETSNVAETVQSFIDTLSESRQTGTVWVLGRSTFSQPIRMRSGVTVDFVGNRVRLAPSSTDSPAPSLAIFDGCDWAHLLNVAVDPHYGIVEPNNHTQSCLTGQTSPLILVSTDSGSVRYCSIRNLYSRAGETSLVQTTSPWHCFDGIDIRTTHYDVTENSFRNIYLRGVCNGIRLEASPGTEIRGNLFTKIDLWRCGSMIHFHPTMTDPSGELRGMIRSNTFRTLRGQADSHYTQALARNISGIGNHFDDTLLWDYWKASACCETTSAGPLAGLSFAPDAEHTYFQASAGAGVVQDKGLGTRIVLPDGVRTTCSDNVSERSTCTCFTEPACVASNCQGTSPASPNPEEPEKDSCYCVTCGLPQTRSSSPEWSSNYA